MKYRILMPALLLVFLTQSPVAQQAPADDDYEARARDALQKIVQEQVDKVKNKANTTESEHEENIEDFVTTAHLAKFSDIPETIDAEIQGIRRSVRLLIRQVAMDIELHDGNSGTLTVDDRGNVSYQPNPDLPKALNEKREQLMRADLDNRVSARSAALALKILAGINDSLKAQAANAQNSAEKRRVFLTQAVYVYEMADIVLELLDGLEMEGKPVLEELHREAEERVRQRGRDIDTQVKEVQRLEREGLFTPEQARREEETLELMRKASQAGLESWGELMEQVGSQEDFLANIKSKKDVIAYKREKARLQVETLRDFKSVVMARDTIGSMDDLVNAVADLDLLVLDENTVRELLGYGYED